MSSVGPLSLGGNMSPQNRRSMNGSAAAHGMSQFVQFCAVICMGNVMKITQLEVRTVRWVKFELSNPNSGLAEFELFVVRYLPNVQKLPHSAVTG